MAMSLEELLNEEGFKKSRSKLLGRASFSLGAGAMLHYSRKYLHKSASVSGIRKSSVSESGIRKTERRSPDTAWFGLRDGVPTVNRIKERTLVDDLIRREKVDKVLWKGTREKFERVPYDPFDIQKASFNSSEDLPGNEVELGDEEGEGYKDTYSEYSTERSRGKYSDALGEKEKIKRRSVKDTEVAKRSGSNSTSHLPGSNHSRDKYRKSMKQPETSYSRSDTKRGKSFDDRSGRWAEIEKNSAEPALNEAAVQAMISILSGYGKHFVKDEDFRTTTRHNCFTMLKSVAVEEDLITESKVIFNLEQGIETVERAAQGLASAKELKKALLQLSVITGLNLSDLKDGFTSGIPNSKLSACGHLYLSVIYTLRKKDKIAAKHILQVFCDSPFQARTLLLPELWDYVFFPHLSHLREWYNQEADSLADTPSKARKQKLLQKVYNQIMDSGTYQFASYYKDWLTEGIESPSIPSIQIPSESVQGVQLGADSGVHQEGLFSDSLDVGIPTGPFSPEHVVSKSLYDSASGHSQNSAVNGMEDDKGDEKSDPCIRSAEGSSFEEKQASPCCPAKVKHMVQDIQWENGSPPEDRRTAEEGCRFHLNSAPGEGDANDRVHNSPLPPADTKNTQKVHAMPNAKENELTLKRLAKSVFELQQTEGPLDLLASTFFLPTEDASYPDYFADSMKMRHLDDELHANYENNNRKTSSPSIPQDFICPLTRLMLEDPVTLETGLTFERAAIMERFNHGDRTCPVTGKTLECQSVPVTNSILKRVIDYWKSEHCRHLVAFASQASGEHGSIKDEKTVFVLVQLLSAFRKEERITSAKLLISLGGLQFLFHRFEFGNLEEKTCVAGLFFFCIEADTGCRNYIARNIKKPRLLELIHSNQVKSRETAVLLMIELICLKRRKDVNFFLSGFPNGGMLDTMHVLQVCLQSSPPEQRPLVAVLLLHLGILVEPKTYSIYREQAVDAITVALDDSLSNEKIREKCCRALLILGGRFSSSGKIMTEDLMLMLARFVDGPDPDSHQNENDEVLVDEDVQPEAEYEERQEWLRCLSESLIGDGKKSFLESLSKCLGSGSLDLVRVCLTTVAWLSSALASLTAASHLSAFSTLISKLKESLEISELVEHKILACMSLLNFSKIPECRVMLMTIADEILVPLKSLAEVTWTAKELYAIISGGETLP